MIQVKYEDLVFGKKYYIEFSGKLPTNYSETEHPPHKWFGTFINFPYINASHFIDVRPITSSSPTHTVEPYVKNMTECNFSRLRHRYYTSTRMY